MNCGVEMGAFRWVDSPPTANVAGPAVPHDRRPRHHRRHPWRRRAHRSAESVAATFTTRSTGLNSFGTQVKPGSAPDAAGSVAAVHAQQRAGSCEWKTSIGDDRDGQARRPGCPGSGLLHNSRRGHPQYPLAHDNRGWQRRSRSKSISGDHRHSCSFSLRSFVRCWASARRSSPYRTARAVDAHRPSRPRGGAGLHHHRWSSWPSTGDRFTLAVPEACSPLHSSESHRTVDAGHPKP